MPRLARFISRSSFFTPRGLIGSPFSTNASSTAAGEISSETKASRPRHYLTGYQIWHRDIRANMKTSTGPVFIGGDRPFPYNPDFRPHMPTSDAFRESVYAVWYENPNVWTPRKLANHFCISMDRVKAILKMKMIQRQMEQSGFVPQTIYVNRMESIMGAGDASRTESPIKKYPQTERFLPKQVMVPAQSVMSGSEASKLIGRDLKVIYAKIKDDATYDAPYNPFYEKEVKPDLEKLAIRRDVYETSRFRFVFRDTATNKVYIREKDGLLRNADPEEDYFSPKTWK